jgi:hypothetical protein
MSPTPSTRPHRRSRSRSPLDAVADEEEVELAPQRRDGSLRPRVTVWLVRAGDDLYVRSAVRGRDAAWYRGVLETHRGRLWAGGLETDVDFVAADQKVNDEVDAAYRSKYRRYAGRVLDSCLTAEARSTTLLVLPARISAS